MGALAVVLRPGTHGWTHANLSGLAVARGCLACPPSHMCESGVKTLCPKAFGAYGGSERCTECMPNAQRRDDGAPGCTCVANYFFDGVDPAAQEFLGGEASAGGGDGKCARCPEGALCDVVSSDGMHHNTRFSLRLAPTWWRATCTC